MSINNGPGVYVQPPACVPARYGLLSVAEVEDRSDAHWEMGVSMEHETCDDLFVLTPCPDIPQDPKNTDGGTVTDVDATPFTMVSAYKCSTGGRPVQEAWDHAAARLDRGEDRALEQAFWTGLDLAGNTIDMSLGQNPDVVDITPGTEAVSITDGFALLEAYAGVNYPCSPIIHASRGLGVYFAERQIVEASGNTLLSKGTGSRVVIGGGYGVSGPNGVAAEPGEGWLFATGGIKVVRGATFFTPDRADLAGSIDRQTNDQTVFAERPYAVLYECFAAAIRVNLKSCCC